ncbi:MAG TPA: hypothetical protein VFO21_19400 [Vicinamibacterales bacterium]|nr:hypothetical protein [Vicinamibacterales bacterium]
MLLREPLDGAGARAARKARCRSNVSGWCLRDEVTKGYCQLDTSPGKPDRERLVSDVIGDDRKSDPQALLRRRRRYCH